MVYVAEQVSLGRRVALKVLPGPMSGDRMVQERFRRQVSDSGQDKRFGQLAEDFATCFRRQRPVFVKKRRE